MDDAELKAEQRRNWSAAAAGWDKWWDTIERAAQPLSDRLVALADIRPGQAVLDVATGVGEPALGRIPVTWNRFRLTRPSATHSLRFLRLAAWGRGLEPIPSDRIML